MCRPGNVSLAGRQWLRQKHSTAAGAGLEQPGEGEIELEDRSLNAIPAERRRIGMVFQSYALFPHLSVRDNLDLGLKIRGMPLAERHQRIDTVLQTFN